jgi:hypothetical protein
MLDVLLFAILIVLAVIAREVFLLRTTWSTRQLATATKPYRPDVFTFERTIWRKVVQDLSSMLGVLIAIMIWWHLASPLVRDRIRLARLPGWLALPGDLLGILALSFVCFPLLLVGAGAFMDAYDERIENRLLSTEEREYLASIWQRLSDREDLLFAEHETDRIYREHGM